jgi:hypothetical protein
MKASGKSCRENANAHLPLKFESKSHHVIASAAKQSIPAAQGKMDCFAALAMTFRGRRLTRSRHRPA